jgi:adenylate cyclase
MLAITQFEVLVLQKGRWLLHARYPGEERQEAVSDAQATENATGFPAKVIRETYFPESNESERITAYLSPRAKSAPEVPTAHQRRRPTITAARAAAGALRRPPKPQPRPRIQAPRLTALQIFFRVIVAGGTSLAASSLTTGIFAWALHRVSEGGLDIGPGTRTTLLTYSYVLMFLFFFTSLFRSRLPLHRLLADLWSKTAANAKATALTSTPVNAKPPKVVPKHERSTSPEAVREYEDLKLKRGDLDVAKPPELVDAPPIALTQAPAPLALVPTQPSEEQLAAERAAAERAAEAKAKRIADEQKAEEKRKAKEAARAAEAAKAAEAAAIAEAAANAVAAEDLRQKLNLERMVMRRFAVDVVKAAVQSAMPDDPVARRGAAIVLAGGAAGIVATARLNAMAEQELLIDALQHYGMTPGAIDPFMSQRQILTALPANAMLVAAGRSALAAYLEGAPNVAASLGHIMSNWRTPVGQAPEFAVEAVPVLPPLPLVEVYLLTELREDNPPVNAEAAAEAVHDQCMGTHNSIVRAAVAAHGGHEVKHTGKGIFARFPAARNAVDAAVDMQRAFAAPSATLAIGVIGNTVVGEDPILSANLVRQAQSIVARAGAGEILAEAQVQAAVRDTAPNVAVSPETSATPHPKGSLAEDLGLLHMIEADFETTRSAAPS